MGDFRGASELRKNAMLSTIFWGSWRYPYTRHFLYLGGDDHGGRRSKSADFALLGTPEGATPGSSAPSSPPPRTPKNFSGCLRAILDPAALSLMLGVDNRR